MIDLFYYLRIFFNIRGRFFLRSYQPTRLSPGYHRLFSMKKITKTHFKGCLINLHAFRPSIRGIVLKKLLFEQKNLFCFSIDCKVFLLNVNFSKRLFHNGFRSFKHYSEIFIKLILEYLTLIQIKVNSRLQNLFLQAYIFGTIGSWMMLLLSCLYIYSIFWAFAIFFLCKHSIAWLTEIKTIDHCLKALSKYQSLTCFICNLKKKYF